MPSLEQTLATIPGYGGYLAKTQANRQAETGDLQQAGALMGIMQNMQKQQQGEQIRQVMASSATPEEAITKLSQLGPHGVAAATQIAQLQEHQNKVKNAQALQGLDLNKLLDNPQAALAASTVNPQIGVELERLRKVRENATALTAMRGTPGIQPDPQEVSQAADRGMPAPVASPAVGGIFDGLTQSPNQQIAQQAKVMKAAMERAGSSSPASFWQGQQSALAAREAALLNRPTEPLERVIGPDGKPKFATREDALKQGMTPYSPSLAGEGMLTPETLKFTAEQYLAGDRQAVQGYARSAPMRAALQNAVVKAAQERGMTGAELAAQMAEFSGIMAGSRSVGIRSAQIHLASSEANKMMDIVQQQTNKFGASNFVPWNMALKAFDTQTGEPAVRGYGAAINSLVNVYARAINPVGIPTVSDKDHAREILQVIDSPAQVEAVLGVLRQEMAAARSAPEDVRAELRQAVLRNSKGGSSQAASGGASGGSTAVPEYADEAAAKAAGVKAGTRVKIGGQLGTWR